MTQTDQLTRVSVLAGFGYSAVDPDIQWTDITQWTDIQSAGIGITRGASDELQQTQTGICTLVLDNSDGRFTPGRAASPYFPYVRKRTPILVVETVLDGVNFCANPEFEDSMMGWEPSDPAPPSYGIDDAHVHSGVQSCWISWATSGTGGDLHTRVYGLTLGEMYTASMWVYVPAGSPAVRLTVDGAALGALSTVTGTFTRITVTWTATAGSHTVGITTGTTSPGSGTAVWFDDVQIEEGATASTYQAGRPATAHDRFFGAAVSWLNKWQGLLGTTALTAADLFGWLARSPLQPMLVEEVLHPSTLNLLDVLPDLYYPLSEPGGSASAGEISGNGRAALAPVQAGSGGSLTFASGIGPPSDGLGCPVFAPASATAGIYLACDIGRPLTTDDRPGNYYYEFWFATTVKGRVALHLATNAPVAFETSVRIGLDATSGHLRIDTSFGGLAATSTASTPNLADGLVHHVVYDDAGLMVYVDGTGYAVTVTGLVDLQLVRVGGYGGTQLWDGSIAHVAVYTPHTHSSLDTTQLLSHYVTGTTANAGEDADDRIARLGQYVGVVTTIGLGQFSAVGGQGELGTNALAAMRDCEATEGGKLVCDRGSAAVIIQARSVRYDQASMTSIAWADTETDAGGWADDDQKLTNIMVGVRPGGATQRVSDPDSVAAYGPYQPPDVTLLKMSDAEVQDALTWTVTRYADPPPELRQLVVDVATLPLQQKRALLGADVSSLVTVTDLPEDALAPEASVRVEGYTETIKQNSRPIQFHTSRADTDAVWILDSPVYSVLGSTTRLAY